MSKKPMIALFTASILVLPNLGQAANATCGALQEAASIGQVMSQDQLDVLEECFPISSDNDVTNFVPLLAPALGGIAALALLAGVGGTSSTTGTN